MAAESLNDQVAFLAVARERNFTRAAAKLGVSQSALSQTIRGLEARLGLRLLIRTTRSVAPTEAGERLLQTVGPRLDEIDAELAALSELLEKPAGSVQITADEHAAEAVLWPALEKFLPDYPDIKVTAEVLAMIADVHPERAPHRPRPARETDDWLWESATEFCAALDRYAERAMQIKRAPFSGRACRSAVSRASQNAATSFARFMA